MEKIRFRIIIAVTFALQGCAANPYDLLSTSGSQIGNSQATLASSLIGAGVTLIHSNFYSLNSPNPSNRCAGDANVYFDPISLTLSTEAESEAATAATIAVCASSIFA